MSATRQQPGSTVADIMRFTNFCITTSVAADMVCPRPPLTLTFDRLTLKVVCESHLRWGTFLPNLGTLGLCVLELFAMYATDGQTDRQTKATLIAPFLTVWT